jgi:hypothetical protein
MNSFHSADYLYLLKKVSVIDLNINKLLGSYSQDHFNKEAGYLFIKHRCV